ncbi:hypothetical protein VP137E351_P0064 [Vibrio phage 137E35-1]|nr:hypothetical protein VP137E351_P0064 [Vibrio phage 137E35-1]CAH9016600.1 hypothetical protein VP230E391_P0064 [Vibrio phage 230E39-1]
MRLCDRCNQGFYPLNYKQRYCCARCQYGEE